MRAHLQPKWLIKPGVGALAEACVSSSIARPVVQCHQQRRAWCPRCCSPAPSVLDDNAGGSKRHCCLASILLCSLRSSSRSRVPDSTSPHLTSSSTKSPPPVLLQHRRRAHPRIM